MIPIPELTPMIRIAIVTGVSLMCGTGYAIMNKTKSFGYDTITDLKKRAKKFKKNNYNENKKS